jgi:hypothetical protein
MDEATRASITSRLISRLSGLAELYEKDVITLDMLGRQLFQLVCTPDAWGLAISVTDEEREARRLLMRLNDPDRWRKDSSESEEKRRQILEDRLCEAFLSGGEASIRVLESIIDSACLPHFVGFVRGKVGFKEARASGGRVRVLD